MNTSAKPYVQVGIRQRSLRKHCRLGRATELIFVLATGVTVSIGGTANADDVDWNGGNGTWREGGASLWLESGTTTSTTFTNDDAATFLDEDDVVSVDAGGSTSLIVDDIDFEADNIRIQGDGLDVDGNITVHTGFTAEMRNDFVDDIEVRNQAGGTLVLSGDVDGQVRVAGFGTLDLETSTIEKLVSNGATTNIKSGTVVVGETLITSTNPANVATVTVADGGILGRDDDILVGQNGHLDINGGAVGNRVVVSGNNAAVNLGGGTTGSLTVNIGSSVTVVVDGDAEVAGLTDINVGTLTIESGNTLTATGDVEIGAGGILIVEQNASITVGSITNESTGTSINSGTVGEVINSGDFENTGTAGEVNNSGDFANTGTAGAVTNSGTFVNDTGGVVQSVENTSGTFTNSGTVSTTVVVTDGEFIQEDGGVITGQTDIDNSGTFTFNGGTIAAVNNSGTFAMSESQEVGGVFNNNASGTIDVTDATGTLTLDVGAFGFTTAGDVDTDGTNTLTISASTIKIEDGATFDGTNDLDGLVVLDGAVTNEADLDVTGDMTLTGLLTNTGTLEIEDGVTVDAAAQNIVNTGSLTLKSSSTISNGALLTNEDGGDFTIDNGSSAAFVNVFNRDGGASVTIDGALVGNLNNYSGSVAEINNTGAAASSGSVTGDVVAYGGTVTINGTRDGFAEVTGTISSEPGNGGVSGVVAINDADVETVENRGVTGGDTDITITNSSATEVTNASGETLLQSGTTVSEVVTVNGGTVTNDGADLSKSSLGLAAVVVSPDGGGNGGDGTYVQVSGSADGVYNDGGTADLQGGTVTFLTHGPDAGSTTVTGAQVTGESTIGGGEVIVDGDNDGTKELVGTATVQDGGKLTLTNGNVGDVVNASGTVVLTSGTIDEFTQGENAVATTVTGVVINNSLTIEGGTFTVDGATDGTEELAGTVTVAEGATLTLTSGDVADVVNDGSVTLTSGTVASLDNNTGGGVEVGGSVTVSEGVTNDGTFDVNSGTLTVTVGSFENEASGTLNVADGASVTLAGADNDLLNSGTVNIGDVDGSGGQLSADGITNAAGAVINVNDGSTLTGTGNTTNNSGTVNVFAGGSIVEAGDYNNLASGTVNFVDAAAKTFDVTGTITNSGTINFDAGSTTVNSDGGPIENNAGGEIVIDSGATMDADGDTLVNSGAGAVLTVSGTMIVDEVTNEDSGAVTVSGAITGDLINTADVDINGGSVGYVENQSGGTVDVAGGTIDTGASNSGTFNVNSGELAVTNGAFNNQDGGSLTIDSGATLTLTAGDTVNAGSTTIITVDGTLDSDVTNSDSATVVVNDDGDVTGTVTNTANLDINGGTVGSIDNNTGGDVDVVGGGTVDDGVTNAAAFDINSGTLTLTAGDFDNEASGNLQIKIGSTLATTAGQTNNAANGFIFVGGTLDDDATNSGYIDVGGGDVTGTLTNTGDVDIRSGGSIGSLDNQTGGTVDVIIGGGGTIDDGVTNSGTFDVSVGTLTVASGTFANLDGGSLTIDSGATLTVTSSTTTNEDSTSDIFVNGTLASDVTNSDDATIVVTGDVTGTVTNSASLSIDGGTVGSIDNNTDGDVYVEGVSTVDDGVTNDAAFEIENGTLTLTTGDFDNEANGNLQIRSTATLATTAGQTNNAAGGFIFVGGTLDDDATNSGTISVGGGDVTGTLTNSGDVDISSGASIGTLVNKTDGTVDVIVGGGGTIDDGVTNSGTFDVSVGTLTVASGTFANLDGGSLTIDSGATLTVTSSTTTNEDSTSDIFVNGTLASDVTNSDDATIVVTGDVTGTVTNTADLDVNDGTVGSIVNQAGGDVDVAGGTVDNGVTNSGTFDVNSGSLTVTAGDFANEDGGSLTIDNGATLTLTAGETTNEGSTTIITVEGTLDSDVTNSGSATVVVNDDSGSATSGTITGVLTNTAFLDIDGGTIGTIDNNDGGDVDVANGGTIDVGGVTNAGTFDIDSGTLTVTTGFFTNEASGTLTIDEGATLAADTNNNAGGTIDLFGTITGDVDSSGTLNVADGQATINGSLTMNSGSELSLLGDGPDTTLDVNGDATLNGVVLFAADRSAPTTEAGTINVSGDASGNVTLRYDDSLSSGSETIDNALVFTYSGSTLQYTLEDMPNQGLLDYFVDTTTTPGSALLRSRTGAAVASVAATVGLTQTLVNTIVNRPTSPFVADLAAGAEEDPCGAGAWTRVTAGTADADGSFSDVTAGLDGTAPVSLNYSGLQFGGDFACFGGHYDGWDLAFGAIAGFNDATSKSNSFGIDVNTLERGPLQNVLETDIFQKYAGVYVTAARGRFFADLQYRFEDTAFETTNTTISDGGLAAFSDEEYDNKGQTLSGAFGYSWDVGNTPGLTFVSSAGFSFSKNKTDDVSLGDSGGILSFDDGDSKVGFLSASLAKTTILPGDESLISYFGTVTVYNDFADARTAFYDPTPGGQADDTRTLELENLGAYGELSLGVNYLTLLSPGQAGNARQLNASIRMDARFSEDVESYGITGQIRLQF